MNFLNPFFLFGLVAAAIPVLIHLLNLRKLKNIEFSSLKFLKELQKSKIRKLKIKQILLLVLRTLIIVFLVLAFSRPIIEGSIPGFETYAKSNIAILIDNSISMDISDEFGNRFTQARKAAERIIQTMKESDEAIIIEMTDPNNSSQKSFNSNKELLKQYLSEVKISNRSASLDNSLRIGVKKLSQAKNFAKEIFIISDGQKNIFTSSDTIFVNNKNIGTYFIPIGVNSKSDFENLSCDSIEIATKFYQIGKTIELNAVIKNHSEKDVKGALISLLFNNQKVAQKTFDIQAKSTKTIPIGAPLQTTGAISATVELENDAFLADNRRHFGFIVPNKPNIAIFGERDDNFFLRALFSTEDAQNQITASYFGINEIDRLDLSKYQCLVINNSNLNENNKQRIKEYLSNGGAALFFPDDVTTDSYKLLLQDLGINIGSLLSFSEKNPATFTNLDSKHSIFEGMFQLANDAVNIKQIESAKIFKLLAAKTGIPIIETADGYFLTENQFDQGKVLYFAVAPSLNWSNFPLTTLFPALIFRSIFYLSSTITSGNQLEIGNNESILIPKKFAANGNFKIIDPSGNEFAMQLPLLPTGAILATNEWNETGVYKVKNSQNEFVSVVALNIPRSESYLDKFNKNDLQEKLKSRLEIDKNIFVLDDFEKLSLELKRARIGTELWNIMLFLAILCAIAEMIVQKTSKKDLIED